MQRDLAPLLPPRGPAGGAQPDKRSFIHLVPSCWPGARDRPPPAAHAPQPARAPRVALAARASAAGAQHDTAASHVLRFNLPDEHERAPSDRERGERARSMTRCPSHGATRAMDRSTGRSRRVPSRARTHASEGEANPGRARHGSLRLSDPSYVARHPTHCCSDPQGTGREEENDRSGPGLADQPAEPASDSPHRVRYRHPP